MAIRPVCWIGEGRSDRPTALPSIVPRYNDFRKVMIWFFWVLLSPM